MKTIIKAKGNNISSRAFAGTFWTEGLRKIGCNEVIIDVEGDEEILMLDWNLPQHRYQNQEDEKKFNEYLQDKQKDGWRFCASWGYGMFAKLRTNLKGDK
jgi:hypothetical protein